MTLGLRPGLTCNNTSGFVLPHISTNKLRPQCQGSHVEKMGFFVPAKNCFALFLPSPFFYGFHLVPKDCWPNYYSRIGSQSIFQKIAALTALFT